MRSSRYLLAVVLSAALTAAGSPALAAGPDGGVDTVKAARQSLGRTASLKASEAARARRIRQPQPRETRIAVTYLPGASHAPALRAAGLRGARVRRELPKSRGTSFTIGMADVDAVTAALAATPGVATVERVGYRLPSDVPDDSSYVEHQAGYLDAVRAANAWDLTHGVAGVKIAIIDTGADLTHPDLAAKIDGAYDVVAGTAAVTDCVGHGTFVAGVAGAATDNATGIAGAAWDARLLIYKIDDGTACDGTAADDDMVAAIERAVSDGAKVINISYGGPSSSALLSNAVAAADAAGVVVVSSAGNSGGTEMATVPNYPAAYASVLAVGATDGAARASFSSHGSWVDVAAPGAQIYSTSPVAGSEVFETGSYAFGDGTSFSSPLVAGEAALLRSLRPTLTPAQVRTAITASAAGYSGLGLGAGRVDFRGAFDRLPATGLPTFTAPAAAAVVNGDVTVGVAAGDATSIGFGVDAPTTQKSLPVSGGTASTAVETWGLVNGSHDFYALKCNPYGCAQGRAKRSVTYNNPTPTLGSPAASAQLGSSTPLTASIAGGGLRFYVDGVSVGFDGTAPYSVTFNPSTVAEGAHSWRVRSCSRNGLRCSGPLSAPRSFSVRALHPTITAVTPYVISPNADGKADATTVSYSLPEPMNVSFKVVNASGGTVYGPAPLGDKLAGAHTYVWTGKGAGGTKLADGNYSVVIAAKRVVGSQTLRGEAARTVRLDTVAPTLTSVSGAGGGFYPVKDGYHDTAAYSVTTNESANVLFEVYNGAGTLQRRLALGAYGPGRWTAVWDGRRSDGVIVPVGTYYFEFVASDSAGNLRRSSPRSATTVSHKRLVAKSGNTTVTPQASFLAYAIGACSRIEYPATASWPGSHAYLSDYYYPSCDIAAPASDLAITRHSVTLPAAHSYGTVRISAYGQSEPGYGDIGALVYENSAGASSDYGRDLNPAPGTYAGPVAPAAELLSGRVLRWYAGTIESQWYWIKSFTVSFTYRVLE